MTASQDDMPPPKGIPVRKMMLKLKVGASGPFVLQKVILQRSSKAKLTNMLNTLESQILGILCNFLAPYVD